MRGESRNRGNFLSSITHSFGLRSTVSHPRLLFAASVVLSMSLCSHSIRAISRSRPKTLLPFLYQTATIQQWNSAAQPLSHRNISSRSRLTGDVPHKDTDAIPFQDADGNLPPSIEQAQSVRQTTITDTERAAFERLYKKFNTEDKSRQKGNAREHDEEDQVADEYYEDEEDPSSGSLDNIFDAVLRGSPRSQGLQGDRISIVGGYSAGKGPRVLDPEDPRNAKILAQQAEKEEFKRLLQEERARVDDLLKSALTDRELWEVLEREVFAHFRTLDLDGLNSDSKDNPNANKSKSKSKAPKTPTVDTRILFPNYPHHLLTALVTLRTRFPSSPLALTIPATMKAIGRSSYALGATPKLYKHLLRTAWLQQSSYTMMDALLTDMETNIVEFDLDILEVLDAIIKENELATGGRLGREMQLVYGMDMWVEGIRKISVWRGVVAERLGVTEEVVQEKAARQLERAERPVRHNARRTYANGRDGRDDMMRTNADRRNDAGGIYMNPKHEGKGESRRAYMNPNRDGPRRSYDRPERDGGVAPERRFTRLERTTTDDTRLQGLNPRMPGTDAGLAPVVEGVQPLQGVKEQSERGSLVRFVQYDIAADGAKDAGGHRETEDDGAHRGGHRGGRVEKKRPVKDTWDEKNPFGDVDAFGRVV
jgi:hypothetical protein